LILAAWLLALIGYFGPWVGHKAAALAWNAYDLSYILRFLPQIESLALDVNLQALRLPLVGLAVLLPLLFADARPGWRWGATIVGALLTLGALPPYPHVLTAWNTPGWRVPFWWAIGGFAGAFLGGGLGPHLGALRPWLIVGWTAVTGIPAFVTFYRLLPALRELYDAPVPPGWGMGICAAGLLTIGVVAWGQGLSSKKGGTLNEEGERDEEEWEEPEDEDEWDDEGEDERAWMAHIRTVKGRYEEQLMRKRHVVGVGIGLLREPTEGSRVGIVVNVTRKVPEEELPKDDRIPDSLEGVPVEVQEVGAIKAQA
jgi:hypothetical protein